MAKTMRKMQTPAYWPVVLGEKAEDQRGVVVEVKKTMDMVDMLMEESDMVIEVSVAIDIAMELVAVAMDISTV